MSYAITNAKGLAGIGHPMFGGLGASPAGGHDGTGLTSDGTTHGDRAMMLVALSIEVAKWQKQMQDVLDGKLSITSSVFRPIGGSFNGSAMELRGFLQTARTKLASEFMPIVAAALRDGSRSTKEVMDTAVSYLDTVAAQFKMIVAAEDRATVKAFAQAVLDAAGKTANDVARKARDLGKQATTDVFPVWFAPAAGLFLVAYLWNTFRVR